MQIGTTTALIAVLIAGAGCTSASPNAGFSDAGTDDMNSNDAGTPSSNDPGPSDPPPQSMPPPPPGGQTLPPPPPPSAPPSALFAVRIRVDETVSLGENGEDITDVTATLLGLATGTSTAPGGAHLDTQLCAFSSDDSDGDTTALPISAASPPHLQSYAKFGSVSPGASFDVTEQVLLIGWSSTRPGTDALPEADDDPRLVDVDNDGNPGITAPMPGHDHRDLYIAARLRVALAGKFQDQTRVSGATAGTLELSVVGARHESDAVGVVQVQQTTTANVNDFEIVAVRPGTTCATITGTASNALFP